MLHSTRRRAAGAILAAALLGACSTDAVIGVDPTQEAGTFTVNATTGWAFVSLADSSQVTPLPSASESAAWDLAFFGTNVTANGGEAGPGGVSVACLCQNAAATGEEVLAMTAESELADFEAVTTVPAGADFQTDVLAPAITGWFTGTGATAAADTSKSWLLRLSDSTSFALVRVAEVAAPSASDAGTVTLEYRLQAAEGEALGAIQTLDVSAATATRVDLNTGSTTTDAAAWDLSVEGFTIRVNGGISGAGKAGAAVNAAEFAATTTAVTSPTAYRSDVYAGTFGSSRYYRYNIAGDHRISPTFDVYLVRRGSTTYKLQVIGYYSATGQARHITFRWAQLD